MVIFLTRKVENKNMAIYTQTEGRFTCTVETKASEYQVTVTDEGKDLLTKKLDKEGLDSLMRELRSGKSEIPCQALLVKTVNFALNSAAAITAVSSAEVAGEANTYGVATVWGERLSGAINPVQGFLGEPARSLESVDRGSFWGESTGGRGYGDSDGTCIHGC
jgi:hypothetical protein